MRERVPLVIGAMLGIAVLGAFGSDAMLPGRESGLEMATYRYLNVELEAPDDPERWHIGRQPKIIDGPPTNLNAYSLFRIAERKDLDAGRELVIDAVTGEIYLDNLSPTHPLLAQQIIDSIRVTQETPEVWPWVPFPRPTERRRSESISYLVPPPASGLGITYASSYCLDDDCEAIGLANGPRPIYVSTKTGELVEGDVLSTLPSEFAQAARRWLESVRLER